MSEILRVRIHGDPVPQGRPRAYKLPSGQIRMYDPKTSAHWKHAVSLQARVRAPQVPAGGPLSLGLTFFLPAPKSAPKQFRQHTKRPDLDNLVKAVLDALKGLAYVDDSQIVSLEASKHYGAPSGVMIVVETVTDAAALAEVVLQ